MRWPPSESPADKSSSCPRVPSRRASSRSGCGPDRATLRLSRPPASVGQLLLVERYAASFARHGLRVGQVLLTADDLDRRGHYRNANRTLERLLALGIAPIVNENDTVATHEIRFRGQRSAGCTRGSSRPRRRARCCYPTSTVSHTGNPRRSDARLVAEVRGPEDLSRRRHPGSGSGVGLGGMATKIEAAVIATGAGIPVLLAAAASVGEALEGRTGTYFHPGRRPDRITAVLAQARVRAARAVDTGSRGHSRRCEPPGIAASGRHHRGERGLRLGRSGGLGDGGRHGRGARPRWLRRGGSAVVAWT